MTIGTILFILGAWVLVILAAVAIDVARDYIPRKKAEWQARKEEKAKFEEMVVKMLTIVRQRRHMSQPVYRSTHGAHRRVRV